MRSVKRTDVLTVFSGAAFVLVVFVGLMFLGGFWTLNGLFGNAYTVSVLVPNARGLASDANVMIAGLEVGRVTSITRDGSDAILSLRIDDAPVPLPANSRVAVRLRSLVGESYVQIFPGNSKQTVPSGGSLGLSQADNFVDVDQILQVLSGTTDQRTRQVVEGLGTAVGDRGAQLNDVLGSAATLITDSLPVTSTLAVQHEQVADLVQNLGDVMNAIGQRTTAVTDLALGARRTFDAIASRDLALGSLLQQLPYALSAVREASQTIQAVAPHISPVVNDLGTAITELSPAVRRLTPASRSGISLLQALSRAADPLRGVLHRLEQLQKPTSAAMPQVYAALCQINPVLKYGAPYGPDLGAFFENFGSAGNAYDATGHGARAQLNVTPAALAGVFTQGEADAVSALEKIGFGELTQDGFDPLPPPGQNHNTVIGRGANGPVEAGKLIKYPHVVADC